MNNPTFPYRPQLSPVHRTQRPSSPCDSSSDKLVTMILKACYIAILIVSATAVRSDETEWRYFGGLLFGSTLSALGGLGLLLLPGKPIPRQVIQARLLANAVCGIGLGACALYLAGLKEIHTGPVFTVGVSFLGGILGVGAIKRLEPAILRRAERYIDPEGPPSRRSPMEEPPTVKIEPKQP